MSKKAVFSFLVGAFAAHRHNKKNPDASLADSLFVGAVCGGVTFGTLKAAEAALEWYRFKTRPRVFISHHHEPDGEFKEELGELGEDGALGFSFEDVSVTAPIKSTDPSRIRADLTRRLRHETDILVVLIGEETHEREYVLHEIDVAQEEGMPIVAVKLDRSNPTPDSLYGAGASWAMSKNYDAIRRAIENA